MVCWTVEAPANQARIAWWGYSQLPNGTQVPDHLTTQLFGQRLFEQIDLWQRAYRPSPPIPHDPVVGPGERAPSRYTGNIRDYSKLLPMPELAALERGVLPLGTAAFGWEGGEIRYGPRLYMPVLKGVPAEQYGVLMCAPPGSGKTHLLAHWAAAAAMNGTSVFALDVKGTLRGVLEERFRRTGVAMDIREFTTDPESPSDRCNLLAGLRADDVQCADQLDLIAHALLPNVENKFWEKVARAALEGLLKLGKLAEWHAPDRFSGGRIDLPEILAFTEREETLREWLTYIYEMEGAPGAQRLRITAHECGIALSPALDRSWELVLPGGVALRGQRPVEHTFQQYMLPLQEALRPYRATGPLGPRVRSAGKGKEIRLDLIGAPGRPTVTIFTAPESNAATGKAVLTVVMRRVRHTLDKRRRKKSSETGNLLILLDETARIEGFDPADFASVSRDNRVGYVFVYQTFSFIRPEERLHALLRNIGTAIYMKEISGPDLGYFNSRFYDRSNERVSVGKSVSAETRTETETEQFTRAPFLEAVAARDPPGGRWPAVVYIRDLKAPFIVDLDDDAPTNTVVKR